MPASFTLVFLLARFLKAQSFHQAACSLRSFTRELGDLLTDETLFVETVTETFGHGGRVVATLVGAPFYFAHVSL